MIMSKRDLSNVKRDLDERGFIILRDFFPAGLLKDFECSIVQLYHVQALKLEKLKHHFDRGPHPEQYSKVEDLDHLLWTLEDVDREVLYQAKRMVAMAPAGQRVVACEMLTTLCAELLECPSNMLLVTGSSMYINMPGKRRLLSNWHNEIHYYPKRRRFLNIWFPLFRSKQILRTRRLSIRESAFGICVMT